ncbi:MAG: hypothetical protein NC413_10625 [Muribaculum sp.]|nr:hypothetical protein [Muribaculum sp.]
MKVMDISDLKKEAKIFCEFMKKENHSSLIGVTDGKAVGTYVEQRFQDYISGKYETEIGSSAKGIDFPDTSIETDIKVTSIVYSDLAEEILAHKPEQGYLTISNALQWRLQYARVIALDNTVNGVLNYEW